MFITDVTNISYSSTKVYIQSHGLPKYFGSQGYQGPSIPSGMLGQSSTSG
jgi:hypothetical protein